MITSVVGVFINKSKIQFESYSQQERHSKSSQSGCLSINQRYNLKAIHNGAAITYLQGTGVYQ